MALLIFWEKFKPLKNSLVPGPLVVVLLGVLMSRLFRGLGAPWILSSKHNVMVPVFDSVELFLEFNPFPDFTQLLNPAVYVGGITIAVVASLETLLNLDAVDKLDRKQRLSPPSRELLAQGVGNVASGLLGGLPVTSVVIRGSVNINAGAESKLSAIFHGILLLVCVAVLPAYLNEIPLSCLAAILLLTGFKLASPKLFRQMWSEGYYQFLPFILTLIAIVRTDLLIGILIGLGISLIFILYSNLRRPIRRIREKHAGGEVLHIELSNQMSFLNRAALESAMREAPPGSRLLLDARRTDYIDPDVLSLIREFKEVTAPVHGIQVHLLGFRSHYLQDDLIESVDLTPQELRDQLTPKMVQEILAEGNARFVEGHPLDRDLRPHGDPVGQEQRAMAAIFTGIDSRTPVEMVFDLALGDAYVVRMPGNVVGPGTVGGLEFAVMNGVQLIVVMGHAQSRLVTAAIRRRASLTRDEEVDDCMNLKSVLDEIAISIDASDAERYARLSDVEKQDLVDTISRRHVAHAVQQILQLSPTISHAVAEGQLMIVPAMYNVTSKRVEFLEL
ncbi:MAG: bifunctional SulP family inorganic anion transporter/carbonic anhydrase [Fuerstia sp.]|nr:bifunctional SulP family inorganic anion transporter/carbonic anhydrase [Fuerstiella sp.]